MSLRQAIQEYLEPTYKCVGLKPHPPDHSTDNALLFTSTYIVLYSDQEKWDQFEESIPPEARVAWNDWSWLVTHCEINPGLLSRYPGDLNLTSHDDYTGVVVASAYVGHGFMAQRICQYGLEHDWWFGDNFLGRIIDFVPLVKVAAGAPISRLERLMAAAGFLGNLWEPTEETSGRCLLYLKQKVLRGRYWEVDLGIWVWKLMMRYRYPTGMAGVYAIYFGPLHPFSLYGPKDFE